MERLIDCHNDCVTALKKDKKICKYLQKMKNIDLILAVWATELSEIQAINLMQQTKNLSSKFNVMTSFEDLHFLSHDSLEIVLQLKPDFAGIVWNKDNNLGGGAYGTEGLSGFGKTVCDRLENENTIIDTAHMNERTFMDFARITSKPLFCSHSALYNVCNTPRNLKDYQCRMIIESGGVLGLCFASQLLTGSNHSNLHDVAMHIEYFAEKFGTDNLCIGTDFYGTKHLPAGIKKYEDISKLSALLKEKGFSSEEVDKIFYKNFQTFLSKIKAH